MKPTCTITLRVFLFVLLCIFVSCNDDNDNYKQTGTPPDLLSNWQVVGYDIIMVSDKKESDDILTDWFSNVADMHAIYSFHEDKKAFVDYTQCSDPYFEGIAEGEYIIYTGNKMLLDIWENDEHRVFKVITCRIDIDEEEMSLIWDYKYNFNNNPAYYLYPYFNIKDTTFEEAKIIRRFRKVK